jgi:hypothetical protein
MDEQNQELGTPMTPELYEMLYRVQMSNYADFPCPYCGKAWESIKDMVENDATVAGYRLAAHKGCWDIVQAGGKP